MSRKISCPRIWNALLSAPCQFRYPWIVPHSDSMISTCPRSSSTKGPLRSVLCPAVHPPLRRAYFQVLKRASDPERSGVSGQTPGHTPVATGNGRQIILVSPIPVRNLWKAFSQLRLHPLQALILIYGIFMPPLCKINSAPLVKPCRLKSQRYPHGRLSPVSRLFPSRGTDRYVVPQL